MKMKALVLEGPQNLVVRDVELRDLLPNELLIKVKACGVCGTDLHMFNGEAGAFASSYPLIMGHEFAGVVTKVGEEVTEFREGDRVAVDPNVYCGECFYCKRGDVHFCERMEGIGTTRDGGFAEYCIVPAKSAYLVDESIDLDFAAMMEPLSCCLHGIQRSNIEIGGTVVIIGFGPIGQMIFELAKLSGASDIVVLEAEESKRELAKSFGARMAIDNIHEPVQSLLDKEGINHISSIIECVGKVETMELAISIATPKTTVMLFGLTSEEEELTLLPYKQIFAKEITITASFINPLVANQVLALLRANKVSLDEIITDRVRLEDAVDVFTNQDYRRRGKILIGDF